MISSKLQESIIPRTLLEIDLVGGPGEIRGGSGRALGGGGLGGVGGLAGEAFQAGRPCADGGLALGTPRTSGSWWGCRETSSTLLDNTSRDDS